MATLATTTIRLRRPSSMTDTQKKELKHQIELKYKEFNDTIERRCTRILVQREHIKKTETSIQGFEQVLCEKHSDKTYTFIQTELQAARKKLTEMKKNLCELQKVFDHAYIDLQSFLEKTFGTPRRGETCVCYGESRSVLYYGKYVFVEVKKYK
jgi:hypothetical protein